MISCTLEGYPREPLTFQKPPICNPTPGQCRCLAHGVPAEDRRQRAESSAKILTEIEYLERNQGGNPRDADRFFYGPYRILEDAKRGFNQSPFPIVGSIDFKRKGDAGDLDGASGPHKRGRAARKNKRPGRADILLGTQGTGDGED